MYIVVISVDFSGKVAVVIPGAERELANTYLLEIDWEACRRRLLKKEIRRRSMPADKKADSKETESRRGRSREKEEKEDGRGRDEDRREKEDEKNDKNNRREKGHDKDEVKEKKDRGREKDRKGEDNKRERKSAPGKLVESERSRSPRRRTASPSPPPTPGKSLVVAKNQHPAKGVSSPKPRVTSPPPDIEAELAEAKARIDTLERERRALIAAGEPYEPDHPKKSSDDQRLKVAAELIKNASGPIHLHFHNDVINNFGEKEDKQDVKEREKEKSPDRPHPGHNPYKLDRRAAPYENSKWQDQQGSDWRDAEGRQRYQGGGYTGYADNRYRGHYRGTRAGRGRKNR
jgi:hypothetical protein